MRVPSVTVFVLGFTLFVQEAHAGNPFDGSLGFCQTISTPMPDPAAPSFYRALPTSDGAIAGAGWSGHVRAWFRFMRNSESGAVRQFLAHEKRLSSTSDAYRVVVIDEGGKLLKETEKATFKKSVQDFNRKTGRVISLVNQYVNESDQAARGYEALRQAILEVQASRIDLLAVRDDYEAFLTEMQYKALEKEKQKMLNEAAEVSQMVSSVISSLANAPTAIPFDAISIMKLLKGDPFPSIIKAAFGPDPARLGALDARLQVLDGALREHRDKGFRNRIGAVRLRLEKAKSAADLEAEAILEHKRKTWQAVHELAGLEREGHGFQFFHALRDYYRAVAFTGASLNEAVNGYYRWLTGTWLSEGEILATHIDVDVDHVRKHDLDPRGEWMNLAAEPAAWLRSDYLPWYRNEVQRVGACITGFKELRHLGLVNEAMNQVIDATGGIRRDDLGRYLF
jgi:hypothetical protein